MRGPEKTVGIIGGMGPEATVDLLRRIIRNTPAEDDADHIRCLVDNNPKVPSRIKALIEGTGEDPAPVLTGMAQALEAAGADFLCMPCNTAHRYYERICSAVSVPVLHMVELAVAEACAIAPSAARVGILASPAVRLTRLYGDALAARGLEAVYPDPDAEDALFEVIKKVKRGDAGPKSRAALALTARHLCAKGADVCIAACTELSVLLDGMPDPALVDASECLAKEVVRQAGK